MDKPKDPGPQSEIKTPEKSGQETPKRTPNRKEANTLLGPPNKIPTLDSGSHPPSSSLRNTVLGNPNSFAYLDPSQASETSETDESEPYILEEIHPKPQDAFSNNQNQSAPQNPNPSKKSPSAKIIKFPSSKTHTPPKPESNTPQQTPTTKPKRKPKPKLSLAQIKANFHKQANAIVREYGQDINLEPIHQIINLKVTHSAQLPHALLAIAIMYNSFTEGDEADQTYKQANQIQHAYSGQFYDFHYLQTNLPFGNKAEQILQDVFQNFISTTRQPTTENSTPNSEPTQAKQSSRPKYLHPKPKESK
jgi:hypothetical protein